MGQATAKTGPAASRKLVHSEEHASTPMTSPGSSPSLEPMAVEPPMTLTAQDRETGFALAAISAAS
jgi:hypothetical protein